MSSASNVGKGGKLTFDEVWIQDLERQVRVAANGTGKGTGNGKGNGNEKGKGKSNVNENTTLSHASSRSTSRSASESSTQSAVPLDARPLSDAQLDARVARKL